MTKTDIERDEKGKFVKGNHAAVKHGGHAFLITGKVPSVRGARALKNELTRIRKELEAGTPALDVKKELLINQVINSLGFMKLFEMYCRKAGILNPKKWRQRILEYQPAFQTYLSMMNAQRSALQALGLDEKGAEEILTPYEIIQNEKKAKND